MRRAIPTPDASRESFAGLLDRLTQPARSEISETDAVRVSISGLGAAALAAEGKRRLAPVKAVARSAVARSKERLAAEATEISYERALRLHSWNKAAPEAEFTSRPARANPSAAETPASASAAARTGTIEAQPRIETGSELPRAGGSRRKVEPSDSVARTQPARPAAAAEPRQATQPQQSRQQETRQISRPARPLPAAAVSPAKLPLAVEDPSTKNSRGARRRSRAAAPPEAAATSATQIPRQLREAVPAPNRGQAPEHRREQNHGQSRSKRNPPGLAHAESHAQPLQPAGMPLEPTSLSRKADALHLALLRRSTALEQRNAVVSIRLNDTEFDRLRERAAESGLSVSAYMRSCVLEAEHLRTQVKQALAEMRSSLGSGQTTPAVTPVSLLNSERSSTMGAWTRFLWRSATFVLAPLLSFRHRA